MMEENRNVLLRSYAFFNKYWIPTIVIAKLSGIWFSLIIAFKGEAFGLVQVNVKTGNKELTVLGWVLTVLLVLFNIYVVIVERYYQLNNDSKELEAKNTLLNVMNSSVNDICKKKLSKQYEKIKNIHDNNASIPDIYTKPCEQIEIILDELSKCISFLISEKGHTFDKEDIQVNLLYNFPCLNSNVWKLAHSFSAGGLHPEEFMGHGSTGAYLLSQRRSSLFFNSKQEALNKGRYLNNSADDKDDKDELKGSICCYSMNFGNFDGTYIKAVLFISTNKKKIVNEKRIKNKFKEVEVEKKIKEACSTLSNNIDNYILVNYSNRIGIELCNFYVDYLNKKEKKIKIEE